MKKRKIFLILLIVVGMVIAGCSKDKKGVVESNLSAKEMTEQMVAKVEQPDQMELQPEEMKQMYNVDPEKLEEYSIRIPMMNIKTNEIAILKVKDAGDIGDVESAVKQRAENVIKQFENYLPDQYEQAKNYKLVTKGNYVLLVISGDADELVKEFDSFFEQK